VRLAPIDAVHLRFADVATLAAERVCRRLGLPVFFTLAPDPHAVIQSRQASGQLDRRSFVEADLVEHLIFRARLVEHLRDRAHGLALLPRASGRAELEALVGLPQDTGPRPVRTVPEGIPTAPADPAHGAPAVQDLVDRIRSLDPARHGRPLILSVGRLHPVKGFPTLVEAWAGDPELRETYNLVVVGGDHERPTRQEQLVLGELALAAGRHPAAAEGLLLIGHRPHRDVLALMAAARAGVPGVIGEAGVYACASVKEEFGLALLEAMASGLSVLGPDAGGPPTYIEDGITGVLTDTSTVSGVREGLHRAAASRTDPDRAARATAAVREHHTIEAMARGLVDLYTA
jgi:glycosyltransferase involved in cell wall biosynthesis